MSNDIEQLAARLRALIDEWGIDAARAAFERQAAGLAPDQRTRLSQLTFGTHNQFGDVTIDKAIAGDKLTTGDNTGSTVAVGTGASASNSTEGHTAVNAPVHGAAVGVNQGTVQLFFGSSPPADGKELLDSYLEWLIAEHGRLRLGKLLGKEQSGAEQVAMPPISLCAVYTSLATNAWVAGDAFTLERDAILAAMDRASPAQVLPDKVRLAALASVERGMERVLLPGERIRTSDLPLLVQWETARREVAAAPDGALQGRWYRPETPLGALTTYQRLVLLGSPGSGKSTVLRYLALILADALLAGKDAERPLPIPIFCPLGRVAQDLDTDPARDLAVLVTALLAPVFGPAGLRDDLRGPILQAWRKGSALLCLDGLDEVSGVGETTSAGKQSRRERIAEAIRQLARQVGRARIVVSCRTKPYEQDASWQLREDWTVRALQSFAFGQVRHFVPAWYGQTCASPQALYTPDEAQARAARLVDALERREALQELTTSPLLLTMLALLDYNHKELPEKRVDVYEELVKLLLDRWEGVRSSDKDQRRESVGERLGLPTLTTDDLRPVIHALAFTAHQQAVDGRGVVTRTLLQQTLDGFFARRLSPANPRAAARAAVAHCSDAFADMLREETGLVQEEADETYMLPHLTFEEYLAACHLADQEDIALAYEQWEAAPDRWREALLLLMGRLLGQRKLLMAFGWLRLLVAEHCGTNAKSPRQRQRDALFAAACYAALSRRAYLGERRDCDVPGFEAQLRAALGALLERPDPAILLPQRIEAGDALAGLDDPRFPVEVAQWRAELGRRTATFGQPARADTGVRPYWCYVPTGAYQIGGPDGRAETTAITLPAFWIARFPLTVAQYAPFVQAGYGKDAERWWTPNGWQWKNADRRMRPWGWGRPEYSGPNQPVIGITWYEGTAFCAWLTAQLGDALPAGYVVRLPTEAEWEAAAAYDGAGQRRPYPWGEEEPDPERAIYEEDDGRNLGRPAPVGCCPAGAAACGALDMAGNVWEMTASSYKSYPAGSNVLVKDFTRGEGDVPWRGGSWWNNRTYVRCGARDGDRPGNGFGNYYRGVRVCLAPALAQMF